MDQVLTFARDVTRHLNAVIRVAKSAIMLEDMMKSAKFAFGKYIVVKWKSWKTIVRQAEYI